MEPGPALPVLNESDTYRELPPPAPARGAVACLWVRRGEGTDVRVLPDACADIVWRSEQGVFVAGPDTAPWFSRPAPGELIVGARLLPGAGGAALGMPLSELRDRRIPLGELGLDRPMALDDDADPRTALQALAALVTALVTARPPDRTVQAGVIRLLDPRERIQPLAGELGLSERQLRRRFQAAVGYGPKTLQRVLRLRRLLAGDPSASFEADLARLAYDAGYADQAHLSRECRALTGLTPAELIRRR
jgi:AraC-like DNA-binding protein